MGGRLGSALLGISRVRFRNPPTRTEIAEMQRGGPPATADDGIRIETAAVGGLMINNLNRIRRMHCVALVGFPM